MQYSTYLKCTWGSNLRGTGIIFGMTRYLLHRLQYRFAVTLFLKGGEWEATSISVLTDEGILSVLTCQRFQSKGMIHLVITVVIHQQ